MKKILVLMLFAASIFPAHSFGQLVKRLQGDPTIIKSQKILAMKLIFDGDSIVVGKDKMPEKEFIKAKKEELNKKDPGRGDNWAKSWVADQKKRFEPSFIDGFFSALIGKMTLDQNAPYTAIFQTTYLDPGYDIYVWSKFAYLSGTLTIVETANPSNVIVVYALKKAIGGETNTVQNFDTGWRLEDAYHMGGFNLASWIRFDKVKKK